MEEMVCWIRYDYVLTRQQYLSFANTRDSSAECSTFQPGPRPGLVGPSSLALNNQRRALHRPVSITTKKVDGNNKIEASRRWPQQRRMRWTVR